MLPRATRTLRGHPHGAASAAGAGDTARASRTSRIRAAAGRGAGWARRNSGCVWYRAGAAAMILSAAPSRSDLGKGSGSSRKQEEAQ